MTKKCPYCAEEIQIEAIKCKHCGSWLAPPQSTPPPPPGFTPTGTTPGTRLTRSTTDRMISGVCGGIGKYMGVDPTLVRIVYALVTMFTALIPGTLAYVILAIVIPPEGTV